MASAIVGATGTTAREAHLVVAVASADADAGGDVAGWTTSTVARAWRGTLTADHPAAGTTTTLAVGAAADVVATAETGSTAGVVVADTVETLLGHLDLRARRDHLRMMQLAGRHLDTIPHRQVTEDRPQDTARLPLALRVLLCLRTARLPRRLR